jgi:hypothetical protein
MRLASRMQRSSPRRIAMQIRRWFATVSFVASIAACGSRQQSPEPAPRAPMAHAQAGAACPMMMDPATTQITSSDTSDGIALLFTTSGDVADLRARVRRMAEMHGMHDGGKMRGQGGMHGKGKMQMHMVPSRATVEDVPDGARILLVPADPAQLAALRQHVRRHAGMMAEGRCPMVATPGPAPAGDHDAHHPSGT